MESALTLHLYVKKKALVRVHGSILLFVRFDYQIIKYRNGEDNDNRQLESYVLEKTQMIADI